MKEFLMPIIEITLFEENDVIITSPPLPGHEEDVK